MPDDGMQVSIQMPATGDALLIALADQYRLARGLGDAFACIDKAPDHDAGDMAVYESERADMILATIVAAPASGLVGIQIQLLAMDLLHDRDWDADSWIFVRDRCRDSIQRLLGDLNGTPDACFLASDDASEGVDSTIAAWLSKRAT